jgi:hypothetical protein
MRLERSHDVRKRLRARRWLREEAQDARLASRISGDLSLDRRTLRLAGYGGPIGRCARRALRDLRLAASKASKLVGRVSEHAREQGRVRARRGGPRAQ